MDSINALREGKINFAVHIDPKTSATPDHVRTSAKRQVRKIDFDPADCVPIL